MSLQHLMKTLVVIVVRLHGLGLYILKCEKNYKNLPGRGIGWFVRIQDALNQSPIWLTYICDVSNVSNVFKWHKWRKLRKWCNWDYLEDGKVGRVSILVQNQSVIFPALIVCQLPWDQFYPYVCPYWTFVSYWFVCVMYNVFLPSKMRSISKNTTFLSFACSSCLVNVN
jgi:hypothetical protein